MAEAVGGKQLACCTVVGCLPCVLKAPSWMPSFFPCVFSYSQRSQHEARPATVPILTKNGNKKERLSDSPLILQIRGLLGGKRALSLVTEPACQLSCAQPICLGTW